MSALARVLGSSLRAIAAVLLDPPGWIPAWVLTGVLVWLVVGAAEGAGSPAKLESARLLADVYKTVLAVWLGYKGLGGIVGVLKAWRGKVE